MEKLLSINPFTQELIAVYDQDESFAVREKIYNSYQSFLKWHELPAADRCQFASNLSKVLRDEKEGLAKLITIEMGKPIKEAIAEIEKCIWLCSHYAQPESISLPHEFISSEAFEVKLTYEPLGPLFAIMPWNFPFWQVFRFSIPTVTAGNTVILKHAPNVTGCSQAISKAFHAAGYPSGVFTELTIQADRSEEVISHPLVKGVTLTGSETAGKAVASLAGKYLKKVVLELGGSDPFIVFEDAEFDKSCTTGLISRMMNAGQVCIAAKRFIIQDRIFNYFVEYQKNILAKLVAGNPLDPTTDLGPMARPDLTDKIAFQVQKSVEMGAKCVVGGQRHPIYPEIYLPTLLIDVKPGMPVYDDETFGPVMIAVPFSSENEAIKIANDTRFGLGASIWTTDLKKARRMMPLLDVGAVFVNSLVKSDPRIPFGGIKNSGFGKELSFAGIKEFMNLKTNWIS